MGKAPKKNLPRLDKSPESKRRKNPVTKPAKLYGIMHYLSRDGVSVKRSGAPLYLQKFAKYDAGINSPVFTDQPGDALVFDHATAKGAAWALGKMLYKHNFVVVVLKK